MVRRTRAFTLVEVLFAMIILWMLLGGLVATIVQSRRLTEQTLKRTLASTIAQSYMEQLKNPAFSAINLANLLTATKPYTAQPTANWNFGGATFVINDTGGDTTLNAVVTTSAPPQLSSLTPGTTPNGAIDNLQDFTMTPPAVNNTQSGNSFTTGTGGTTTWRALWPHATTFPSTTPYLDDLHMNFFIWITDYSSQTCTEAYGITMIYTWQAPDRSGMRYFSDQLHALRAGGISPTYNF